MKSYFLILVLFFRIVSCEECTNVCYNYVRKALADLIQLYKKSPTVSNIPSNYDYINALINKTENIISNIKNLDHTKAQSQAVQNSTANDAKRIKVYKLIIWQINSINKTLEELKQKKKLHQDAVDECVGATRLYDGLRKDVENINETGQNLMASFDATLKLINETKKHSLDVKNDLDEIVVPEALFQKYLCDSRLKMTIQDIIDSTREIADMLKKLFNDLINTKLKDIEEDAAEIGDIIDEIEKNLNEEVPKTDIKVTDETKPTIDELKKQLKDLKEKIDKQLNVDNMLEDILERARKRLKDIVNEEEAILDHLFSAQNIKRVRDEIDNAKQTLKLLKERETLKVELDSVKKLVDTLKERGVCFINDTVKVEQ